MYYWRAAVKHPEEKSYRLVYFCTENLDYVVDVAKMLQSYGLKTYNCYFRKLNVLEYVTNALSLPVATINSFQNYSRSVLIG